MYLSKKMHLFEEQRKSTNCRKTGNRTLFYIFLNYHQGHLYYQIFTKLKDTYFHINALHNNT
jgi:hypothetical protein